MAVQNRGMTGDLGQVAGLVLIDSNPKKRSHAERQFREPCTQVDPLSLRLGRRYKAVLLVATILPSRLMAVFGSMAIALNLRDCLSNEYRIALYNPQNLLLWAVSEVREVDVIFHLAPEYPRIRGARVAHACSAAHEILGYPPECQRETIQPHTVVEDRPVLRVYLSQLAVYPIFPEESAMIDFVRWVRALFDVPVEIFLHYVDRDATHIDQKTAALFSEFGTLIRREDSLHELSSRQISLSGSSSIGYDLLSSNICHLMVVDRGRWETQRFGETGCRMKLWRDSRIDVVNFDSPYGEWLKALRATNTECFDALFKQG